MPPVMDLLAKALIKQIRYSGCPVSEQSDTADPTVSFISSITCKMFYGVWVVRWVSGYGWLRTISKFIGHSEKALAEKKESWKVRSELRDGELAAISKAIYILHNDDARDLFKKSFASQENFLQVQMSSRKVAALRVEKAS